MTESGDEDGYLFLGKVGTMLQKMQPDFDVRNYGFSRLSQLINASGNFTVQKRTNGKDPTPQIYIKAKKR